MKATGDSLGPALVSLLKSGRVVRIGEASLLGHASLRPDERRLDLVHVGRSPVVPGPLCLCVCHFPAAVGFAGIRDALFEGVRAFAEINMPGVDSPEFRVFPGRPLLPEMAASVLLSQRFHAIQCELSVPDELAPLVFYLVAAVEEHLATQGVPPRQISHVRRSRDVEVLPAGGRVAPPPLLPAWLASFLRRSPAAGSGPKTTASGTVAQVPAADSASTGAGHVRRPDKTWRRLLTPAPPRSDPSVAPVRRGGAVKPGSAALNRVVRSVRRAALAGCLDLPATIARAAHRTCNGARELTLSRDDLRFAARPERRDVDRCLLLDASASMAGERARATVRMADFLLRNGRGRMAVIAFQGEEGQVLTGFTRSRRQLGQAMLNFRPRGLTPLAAGLLLGYRTVVKAGPRRVQVILVTDGEPNKCLWSHDSVADALRAADLFRRARIPLVCCGLQGNESLLGALSLHGGARLYVLRDFTTASLLSVSSRLLTSHQPLGARSDV